MSPLYLVSDAVASALGGHDYEVETPVWPGGRRTRSHTARLDDVEADVGLLMTDLVPAPRLREATECLRTLDLPWLLLTGTPSGPLWGAVLDVGVQGIMPSSTGLADVVEALDRLLAGETLVNDQERTELVEEWHRSQSRKDGLVERVHSLTPRERTVLRMLYAGQGVGQISDALNVSEATVRSHVKSVLHKFRVNSQLDAVAVLGWLRDDPESLDWWESA
ncbi:helix-turn-helix transcriptional regulator [Nocardioides coralli]|uniref:helix-turn-helix transcriptional regulator n=1 Tax=Nocardioides coralli TaxID=2872154 RepID=UPI001CA3BDC8|nr:response regulator transcription factor [Nocardioides coralli]QZY29814.1 response regulator transcription factor [Nocardioides coralli]